MSRDLVRLDSLGTEVRIQVHVDVARATEAAPAKNDTLALAETALAPRHGEPQAGQVVGGRYELERQIGSGSMGAVWLARHTTLGERVALKVMAPSAYAGGVESATTAAARFRFEAQVAARLSRKTRHVVRVTDHGQDGGLAYLVMELLEGQTLEEVLAKRAPMPPAEVARIIAQIARGLEVAHAEGVLHRDLKPANVFLVPTPSGDPLVKLLDFGLAHGSGAQRGTSPFATARGMVFGTPGYMSPEQATASVGVDRRADLWSLAVIAYEALTAELPVEGALADELLERVRAGKMVPVRTRRPELPAAYDHFFVRAFALRAADRFATCADLAAAFERAGARTSRRGARARWMLAGAFAVGGAALGTAYALDAAPRAPRGTDATSRTGATQVQQASPASLVEAARAPLPPRAIELPIPAAPAASAVASTETSTPAARLPDRAPAPGRESVIIGDLGEFKSHF